MYGLLDGKVAIVTGGGSGIGQGICLAFANEGARSVVAGRDRGRLEETVDLVRARGGEAVAVTCDVMDQDQVRRCVAACIDAFGGIDILINNAMAPFEMKPLLETTTEMADSQYRSGQLGSMYFMQACYPYLRERRGNVINVGSSAGDEGLSGMSAYAPAKGAIRTLTKVAAREWGPDGIRVNAICPASASPRYLEWAEEFPELDAARMAARPLGRNGDAEIDIGRAVVLLACDYAGYITNNILMLDGGR
jgi:NAD(P)-dependent dehydrogenase (short-subunit alcohol dehydrogenase family)